MLLLRRLTALASVPGELGGVGGRDSGIGGASGSRSAPLSRSGRLTAFERPEQAHSRYHLGRSTGDGAAFGSHPGGLSTGDDGDGSYPPVNLIRAHREELIRASSGKLDHMVIDVVGSLFDQILSDSRVPPQMARQIARLQLPVLRVALSDQTFFSTRRHPVRRFINRMASLACAFEDFNEGPGSSSSSASPSW
jgi:hypothetical protein